MHLLLLKFFRFANILLFYFICASVFSLNLRYKKSFGRCVFSQLNYFARLVALELSRFTPVCVFDSYKTPSIPS